MVYGEPTKRPRYNLRHYEKSVCAVEGCEAIIWNKRNHPRPRKTCSRRCSAEFHGEKSPSIPSPPARHYLVCFECPQWFTKSICHNCPGDLNEMVVDKDG